MSWRDGSRLFLKCWPHIRSHVTDATVRDDFTKRLVELFSDFDMDPHDLIDVDPELDAILGAESTPNDPDHDVACCINGLTNNDESIRRTSAEAIVAFVGDAGGSGVQDAADALLRTCVDDSSDSVRVVALKSLRAMIDDYPVTVLADEVVPLTDSDNSNVSEQVVYLLRAIERNS